MVNNYNLSELDSDFFKEGLKLKSKYKDQRIWSISKSDYLFYIYFETETVIINPLSSSYVVLEELVKILERDYKIDSVLYNMK